MTQRIALTWTRRGHNTIDPTGQQIHRGRATWAVVETDKEAVKELKRAEKYCRKQPDWTS
jgi:hypothetical protein